MEKPKLVKERWPEGSYRVSGSIEGLVEGRRTIRELRVRNAVGSLEALGALSHLEVLNIDGGQGLDLGELAALSSVRRVNLTSLRDTDLGALRLPESVRMLWLFSPDSTCVVSRSPALPVGLVHLGLLARGVSSGVVLGRFVDAVKWDAFARLESLDLSADSTAEGYPIEVDLGLFRSLPGLERLDVFGFRHRSSAGPSPLEPPFDGLPKSITSLRIDTELEVEALKPQVEAYLGCHVSVGKLYPPEPSDQAWWLHEPDAVDDAWITSGSLADHFADRDFAEEAQGLRLARSLIKQTDPDLLKRLDFDQDSDSTMIMAGLDRT